MWRMLRPSSKQRCAPPCVTRQAMRASPRGRLVAATATALLKRLADAMDDRAAALPEGVRDLGQMYLAQIAGLTARVADLDLKMGSASKEVDVARQFQTLPGVGPITALAIETFAPDLATFRRGRTLALAACMWCAMRSRLADPFPRAGCSTSSLPGLPVWKECC